MTVTKTPTIAELLQRGRDWRAEQDRKAEETSRRYEDRRKEEVRQAAESWLADRPALRDVLGPTVLVTSDAGHRVEWRAIGELWNLCWRPIQGRVYDPQIDVIVQCPKCWETYEAGPVYNRGGEIETLAGIANAVDHPLDHGCDHVEPEKTRPAAPPRRYMAPEEAALVDAMRNFVQANTHEHYEE